jgi:hypothetical protein
VAVETVGRPFDSARCVVSCLSFFFKCPLDFRRARANGVRSRRGSETCPFGGQVHENKVDAANPSRSASAWTANYILDSAVPPSHRERCNYVALTVWTKP